MSEINLECCHLEGSHFSVLWTSLFIHYCFNEKCFTPHSAVIQDTHFLLTSTGWAGSTPTHSDLSSVSLSLTSTFQYGILIRPIFSSIFFPLGALHILFSGIFLEVNFFTSSHFLFQLFTTIIKKESILKDRITNQEGAGI